MQFPNFPAGNVKIVGSVDQDGAQLVARLLTSERGERFTNFRDADPAGPSPDYFARDTIPGMAILAQNIAVMAKVSRANTNSLYVEIVDTSGQLIGTARQKFGAGVLFGFKNGGKSRYTLTAGERQITIDVAGSTTISEGDLVLGRIVPHDGGVRLEDGAGGTLAHVRPFTGMRGDDPWIHPVVSSRGEQIGQLSLM